MNLFRHHKISASEWLFIVIALAVGLPLIFMHLGHLPLRVWDEARLAVNAYEMLHNHGAPCNSFLVTTYEGVPDLWNTKPPLLIWLQVISMRCFGINEVAFRLPSALAVFLTCVLFYAFLRHYLKDFRFGFIHNMILLTATGLFTWHAGKNGDYDAPLMLLSAAYGLTFFIALEKMRVGQSRAIARNLYLFYFLLSLAILTKSSAALLFLPALVLYALLTKQFLPLLKNKHTYIGLLIPIILVGGFYIAREMASPGYLRAVWENEFGGRFMTVIEEHGGSFWCYVKNLLLTRFEFWTIPAVMGAVLGLRSRRLRLKRLSLFSVVMVGVYGLIISLAQTKIFWYDLPMYPFLAILASVFVFRIFECLKTYSKKWLSYAFLVCLFAPAVVQIYKVGFIPRETTDWEVDTHIKTHYLRELCRHGENIDPARHYVVVKDGYYAQHLFYIYLLQDKGVSIDLLPLDSVRSGDRVLCDKPETAAYLSQTFEATLCHKERVLEVYDLK